jgi:phosphorylase kinase alpha/beta subunit
MLRLQNPRLAEYLRGSYTADDLKRLHQFLDQAGTFDFPALPSGLFPAAHVAADHSSGYASIWIRDNAHVAHALFVDGQTAKAAAAVAAMAKFFRTQLPKIADVLAGKADAVGDPMLRPHIRFDGHKVAEIDVKWSHAQNDALGYFLWIAAKLIEAGALPPTKELGEVLAAVVLFLERIEFWRDEDSGHWEETRKRNASSIGAATAGLAALRDICERPDVRKHLKFGAIGVAAVELDKLVQEGMKSLGEHLPHECIDHDPAKHRKADGALLFLLYPLELVDEAQGATIIESIVRDLQGEIGIRRYLGDSYWCADYKEMVTAEKRSADFSDDLTGRDALLQAGQEAQWCIFDPVLSAALGRRYQRTGDAAALGAQTFYFNRSLAHLTADDCPFGALKCPESYYLEKGRYVPVDQTPLLWTQGNLLIALRMMEQSLEAKRSRDSMQRL